MTRRRLWLWTLALALPFVLALAARLAGSSEIFEGEQVHLIDPDSHYHARRMVQALEHFPEAPPLVDPLIAAPEGYLQVWPPGFDVLGGALGVLTGASPEGEEMARLGTLLVVFLGALTTLLLVVTLRRYVAPLWAGLGGVILALWPLHIEYSRIGRIDHHVLEPLWTLLLLALYFFAAAPRSGHHRRTAVLTLGAALGASLWLWPTALFPVAVIGALGLLDQLWHDRRPVTAAAFGIALCLAAPLCLAEPYRGSWALHTPSLLHLSVLAAVALISLWFKIGRRRLRRGAASRPLQLTALLLGGALLASLPLVGLWFSGELEVLLSFGKRQGLWSMVLEQRSLFSLPWAHQVLLVTYLFFILPLLWIASLLAPRPEGRRQELLLWWVAAMIFTAAGLAQVRFLPLALPLNALLCATGLAELHRRLRGALDARVRPGLQRLLGPALALGALTLMWPASDYILELKQMPSLRSRGVEQAARWLRRHPLPSPTVLISPLGAAHAVVHLARQAVVGSPLIAPHTERANRETVAFFTEIHHGRAEEILRRRGVQRVLQTSLKLKTFLRLRRTLGSPPPEGEQTAQFRRCMASRLTLDSGSARQMGPELLPAIGWLQHQWETGRRGYLPVVQVFKVVKGARLQGRASPGHKVQLQIPLVTNSGRRILFWSAQSADKNGDFTIRVPYWTTSQRPRPMLNHQGDPTITLPAGPATLITPEGSVPLVITQQAVERGLTIFATPPSPARSAPLH